MPVDAGTCPMPRISRICEREWEISRICGPLEFRVWRVDD